jgi:signal peptidase I
MAADGDLNPALSPEGHSLVGEGPPASEKGQTTRAVREIVETLLLAALIFFLVRLVVLNFRVDGESMLQNLDDGEMLLVNRNAYQFVDINGDRYYPFDPPERGDVIVFNPPNGSDKPYIKRIIGLPGEEITFGNGHVYVNGKQLEEDYIEYRTNCGRRDQCDVVVPPDHVFVLGDHRTNSSDSRVFGPVPVENIIGKAWLAYWPLDDVGFVPHEDYPASVGETPLATATP